jgi:hypothetical protein
VQPLLRDYCLFYFFLVVNVQFKLSNNHKIGCMKWFLPKGDPLPGSAPKKATFKIPNIFDEDQPRISNVKLFVWDGDDPPCREQGGLYEVYVLSVDLTNVQPDRSER